MSNLEDTMRAGDLVDRVTQAAACVEKASKIASALGQDTSMHGGQLHLSLVLSGVALGAEEAIRATLSNNMQTLASMRGFVAKLDAALLTCNDDEAVALMGEIKASFESDLRERANTVRSAMLRDAWDRYRIPEAAMLAPTIDDVSEDALQSIGYKTFMTTTMLFFAWDEAQTSGRMATMKCHCGPCVMEAMKKVPENPEDATFTVFTNHGGMASAFTQFGGYVLEMMRESLVRAMEGTKVDHGPDQEMNAEAAMQAAMRALREGKKNVDDNDQDSNTGEGKPAP
jgi:hypothetical protein